MQTLGKDEKREDIRRGLFFQSAHDPSEVPMSKANGSVADLGHSVATHDCGQSCNVHNHEDALRAEDVPAFVGDVV